MKIFATSDIHGNKLIMSKLKQVTEMCDLILICGDIGGKDIGRMSLQEFSNRQRKDVEHLDNLITDLELPCKFILGNDDWFEFSGDNYLNKSRTIARQTFIPFEFVLTTPFNTNREVNENKLNYELSKLSVSNNDIVVAHTPPFCCGDVIHDGTRVGSKSVRDWISKIQPKIWLCGHIHENFSISEIGRTKIFNCACSYTTDMLRGWLIDTETLEFERVEF